MTKARDFANVSGGLLSTSTELNLLDGCTATTTELNYLDGVTSNIQTQIDNAGGVSDSKAILYSILFGGGAP